MAISLINDSAGFASKYRKNTFFVMIVLFALLFIGRLAQLQIIQGPAFKSQSEAQAIKKVRILPYRGNMYDRNGNMIVKNEGSFSVTLTPNDFKRESMPLLAEILKLDSNIIYEEIKNNRKYSRFTPIRIYRDASPEIVAQIEEYNELLPGIDILTDSKRLYDLDANMPHILGYTREISAKQLENKSFYNPGDIVGQTGLESSYENELRGKEGFEIIAVNNFGQRVDAFGGAKNYISASNGYDLYLSIDIRLQKIAEELLKGQKGALVAIDVNTGEILAIASKPDYDIRQFTGKIPAELYSKLSTSKDKPLFHRAVMAQYPPGSTWKMLIALAGLQEGIITKSSTFLCVGGFKIGQHFIKCHGAHGNIAVERAIQGSCNAYFNQLAIKLGFEKFYEYGKLFGFGMHSGLDLPSEKSGLLPSREYLENRYGKYAVSSGRLANFGIGQGEILVTPVQMAVYTAAIANNGIRIQPHVVKAVNNHLVNKIEEIDYSKVQLPIDKKHFEVIKKSMFDVVNTGGGTAGSARLWDVDICGKTGTAQNPHGKDHAWFVSFAPYKNPEIAVVVFVENAGFGGDVAAPIARKFYDAYFHPDSLKVTPESIDEFPLDTNKIVEN